jgi:phosphoribosyl 1,2-cyclic phosphate phosphodiesterase
MNVKVTVLGCGNSAGVPSIGNVWGQCDPNEPRNRRTRPSIAIESGSTTVIVDTGPDFKAQINNTSIGRVHGVIYTHAHSDHTNGIDELRVLRLRHKELIPVYSNLDTINDLRARFSYMFSEIDPEGLYPQVLVPHVLDPQHYGQPLTIGDINIVPFEQSHGSAGVTLGLRIGNLAYSTDMFDLDQQALETLSGIDTWIVDAAGYKMPHNFVHATLKQVLALNDIVQAKNVYLTHMPSFMDYQTLLGELPSGFKPAYDGLVLEAQT